MTLLPAAPGVALVACNTCRSDPVAGTSAGARLAAALRTARDADPAFADIAVEDMACLFACGDGCAVHLRGPGRIGYVLGRFDGDAGSVRAILDYAVAYAATTDGEVPFAAWPDGVKGHFLTRTPPPGYLVA